jgi:hypothetical protein
MWVTVSPWDINDKIPYVFEEHKPVKLYKRIPWLVCKNCGLIYLRNDLTLKAIRLGCNWRDK